MGVCDSLTIKEDAMRTITAVVFALVLLSGSFGCVVEHRGYDHPREHEEYREHEEHKELDEHRERGEHGDHERKELEEHRY
jgi:hypothetical protein